MDRPDWAPETIDIERPSAARIAPTSFQDAADSVTLGGVGRLGG